MRPESAHLPLPGRAGALMALSPRIELRLSQQLVMTPQLQQAIKLLQMSNLQVAEYLAGEVEKNPLLELAPPAPGATAAGSRRSRRSRRSTITCGRRSARCAPRAATSRRR
jgi:DNA-directed RNA polymerase specialized sigma54-like protein